MKYFIIFFNFIVFFTSCTTGKNISDSNDYWSKYLSKEVTVRGTAENMKVGAFVAGKNQEGLYIESLGYWPDGFSGKEVEVTGVLIKKYDLPVFIPKEGEPVATGIPVSEGTDLHEASKRYLLKNATWKLIE
jgi:hypothetical protein